MDQKCGKCYGQMHKVITLPQWLFNDAVVTRMLKRWHHGTPEIHAYKTWYLCHEMSHALVGNQHNHNAVFMRKLIEITPPESLIYELGYKPRNAAAAGIAVDIAMELGFF